jgi:hypothetical protein
MRLISLILSFVMALAPVANTAYASDLNVQKSESSCCHSQKSDDGKKKCKKKCCHQSSACHQNCCSSVVMYLTEKPNFEFLFSQNSIQKVSVASPQNTLMGFENDFLRPPIRV